MAEDPRLQITRLLETGWEVIGTSSHLEEMEDNTEWASHRLILKKDSSIRCYEISFHAGVLVNVQEFVLSPGKYN
jgi:hypothetical protein